MSEESDAENDRLHQQTTGEDRVRMVARQLAEPQTANWIANEAEWSHGPTKRVLERLVDDGILRRDARGAHTTYVPDRRRQAMQEAMRLRDAEYSVEELTDRLAEMQSCLRDWEAEFGVDSPNQLRATIAEEKLDPDEETRRRDVAREWEHLRRRIQLVGFVIREWDFLEPASSTATAEN